MAGMLEDQPGLLSDGGMFPPPGQGQKRDWSYYAGPHLAQGVRNVGGLAEALLNLFGPGADVKGMVGDSAEAMKAARGGDMLGAASSLGMAAAAVPMMFLPGSVAGAAKAVKGIKAYHGSPNDFDAFVPSPDNISWFSTSERTAEEFGKDRMGLAGPRSSYFKPSDWHSAKPKMYEVNINKSNLDVVYPMKEARAIAKEARLPRPRNWADAADILQWAAAQEDYIYDAVKKGRSGVLFRNVGDTLSEIMSDHIAVFDPKIIEIMRKYGILPAMLGGGAAAGMLGGVGEAEAGGM